MPERFCGACWGSKTCQFDAEAKIAVDTNNVSVAKALADNSNFRQCPDYETIRGRLVALYPQNQPDHTNEIIENPGAMAALRRSQQKKGE